jgi:hypothetical protein
MYYLMATDTRAAYTFWEKVRSTGRISQETIATWLFTMLSAEVARGSPIATLQRNFRRDWQRYEAISRARNPTAIDVMARVPDLLKALQGHIPFSELADDEVEELVERGESPSAITIAERLVITVAAAPKLGQALAAHRLNRDTQILKERGVRRLPLVPLAEVFSAIDKLTHSEEWAEFRPGLEAQVPKWAKKHFSGRSNPKREG